MSISIERQYNTLCYKTELNTFHQYITPKKYFDPRKEILTRELADYKNKPRQKKFEATSKHKNFFGDEVIKPFAPNPSPDKYKTVTDGMFGQFNQKNNKIKRTKSAALLKKVDPKITRGSYINDIEKFQAKYKSPGVGKYDMIKEPFKKEVKSPVKSKQIPRKFSSLDDIQYLSNTVPGCGHYNPRIQVPKLKENRTSYKQFIAKHKEQQQKQASAPKNSLGPTTYTPISADTFDSIAKNKSKSRPTWGKFKIDLRKGARSQMKLPSPAQYQLINQWSARNLRQKETQMGKVKLFDRISKNVRALSVYH